VSLHPEAVAFLEAGKAANLPDLAELGAYKARLNSHNEPKDLGGPLTDQTTITHGFLTSHTADLPIRIYTPKKSSRSDGLFNGIVYFHGGGWVLNNLAKYESQLADMAAKTNSVIISVNYQKAPEHKFPVPFNDCYESLEWVFDRAADFKIDPSKIGVGGDSAGGNLASAVALAARDRGRIKLAFQWLIYPCNGPEFVASANVPNAIDYGLTQKIMKWLWEAYLNPGDERNPYAVPHAATSLAGLPPTILLTAEYDVLRDDGIAYKDKLIAAGVPVAYKDAPGMIHGFFNYGKFLSDGIKIREYFADEINRIVGA
jgi:acetyl esterase